MAARIGKAIVLRSSEPCKDVEQTFMHGYMEQFSCIVPFEVATTSACCTVCDLGFTVKRWVFDDVLKHVESVAHVQWTKNTSTKVATVTERERVYDERGCLTMF